MPKTLEDFRQHLIATGLSKHTIETCISGVRGFLRHIGNERHLDRISEESVRSFFAGIDNRNTRRRRASDVSQFLNFALSRLPVVINNRGNASGGSKKVPPETPAPAPSKKELALRRQWSVDKLSEQKEAADDLTAKLARKVIDHFLYFQDRLKGEPENLDDLCRFADECRELIQSNLPLFMTLSAQGRNIHSAIDERVQK
jgi:Phage integrase, N-terminal SAM-like domain